MLLEEQVLEEVQKLKAELVEREPKVISGAALGVLVSKVTPRINVQELGLSTKGTFTHFVRKYLSDVLNKIGRSGGDWLYQIIAPGDKSIVLPDYEYWLAFARSDYHLKLSFNSEAGHLVLVPLDVPDVEDIGLIESITLDELEGIKLAFVESEQSLGERWFPNPELSYPEWVKSMQALSQLRRKKWANFRVHNIKEVFNRRLLRFELPSPEHQELLNFFSESLESKLNTRTSTVSRKHSTAEQALGGRAITVVGEEVLVNEERLRKAAIRTVQSLSYIELRDLKLPIGAFSDALLETMLENTKKNNAAPGGVTL